MVKTSWTSHKIIIMRGLSVIINPKPNFFLHLSIEKEIVGRTKRKTGEKNGGIESNDLNRYNATE